MLCINPYRKASAEFGCGQCICCRINRKRTWAARIVLESLAYRESSFVTLTYDDEHLPADNSLSPEHWREFTKGCGYRYFGCGEYGSHGGRPHFHLVVFGLPPLMAEDWAKARWPYGFVSVRPFCAAHGAYVASYTVKKMTSKDDFRLSPGQHPEFARMSRRPAIGTPGITPFRDWLWTSDGVRYLADNLDVPSSVRINGGVYSMGRTLRDKLRDAADIPSDVPARTARRELLHRLRVSDPVLRASRERKRVAVYERRRALASRRHGSL